MSQVRQSPEMGGCSRLDIFLLSLSLRMSCSIEQLTYTYSNPKSILELNLSSTSNFKIHEITHLEPFVNLRTLILSNNMIRAISGLDHLRMLKVLNLEFNCVQVVDGTQGLINLEELYIGYNEIERLGNGLTHNKQLRVLHLAYNDIKNLDGISILYQSSTAAYTEPNQQPESSPQLRSTNSGLTLPNLSTLSLYGNPIISTINYISFLKMLIPTLLCIDDRNVDDQFINSGSICPQEEVVILREAINRLLDERDQAVGELEDYQYEHMKKQRNSQAEHRKNARNKPTKQNSEQKKQKQSSLPYNNEVDESIQNRKEILKQSHSIIQSLEQCKKRYLAALQNSKQRVNKMSQIYSQNLKNRANIQQGLDQTPSKFQHGDGFQTPVCASEVHTRNHGKQILKQLKIQQKKLQQEQLKIRNINKMINYIEKRKLNSGDIDVYKIILEMVIFGYQLKQSLSTNDIQKLIKKYLIKSVLEGQSELQCKAGLIYYNEMLKKVISGESEEGQLKINHNQILELKQRIGDKGLLQIISELREASSQQQIKYSKFEKQRKNFIDKFEHQTQELTQSWLELRKEKEKFQQQKKRQTQSMAEDQLKREAEMKKKYKITEEEQRTKIIQLKRAREKLEIDVDRLKLELAQADQTLNRRFIQLEQFQNHFNEFIEQKEHIKSLEIEINEISVELDNQKQSYNSLTQKVKQLTLQEGILETKQNKLEQIIRLKNKEIVELDNKKYETNKTVEKNKQLMDRNTEKLRDVANSLVIKIEQLKDYEKLCERAKKNLGMLEQKVKNINSMESNKKLLLNELEQQLKVLKQDKITLSQQIGGLEKTMDLRREELINIQLKIQENKLSMQNLADINKNISDMMIRQSQLKRSIIELEIENKNLMQIKNNMIDDFRIKHYV